MVNNKLSRHSYILQSEIRLLFLDLYLIRGLKFNLDCLSPNTITLLDSLNDYLNRYEEPSANLKSIIDFFVKILIDAIDHDIDELTKLISYLNIFVRYYKIFIHNIKNFYKYSLSDLYNKISCFCKFYPNASLIGKVFHDIDYIKLLITRFHDYESVLQHFYYIERTNSQIKRIKYYTLEPLTQCLELMESSDLFYIFKIKDKLQEFKKPDHYLYNIQKLTAIKSSQEYLITLRENMRDIRNDIKHFKKNLLQNNINLRILYNDISSKMPKTDNDRKMTKETYFLDSQFYFKDVTHLLDHKIYVHRMFLHNLEAIEFIDSIISDIDLLLGYIPNLSQKLLNAKSKLDKTKLLEYIINLIDTINIIISVEPSEIVNHLKPIYSIKRELESIVTSCLTSHISNIQPITSLVTQLKTSIDSVPTKLKEAIKDNMTVLCRKITEIEKAIKCLKQESYQTVKVINCIIKLSCQCKHKIITCFQNCLKEIRYTLQDLWLELHELYCSYYPINCLINETQNIFNCAEGISSLKTKIPKVINKFKCSITQFKIIESKIECAKQKIQKITQLKPELCKEWEKINSIICVSNGTTKFKIVIINVKAITNILKSLVDKIDKLCSEFGKINELCSKPKEVEQLCSATEKTETSKFGLKELLVFNSCFLQIACCILKELESIQSSVGSLTNKKSDLENIGLSISLISSNVKYIKNVVDKMNNSRECIN